MNAASQALSTDGAAGVSVSGRFVDNGDGTVTDTRTGLMWSKATNTSKEVNHEKAGAVCKALDLAGHTDWRLPTIQELLSIADHTRSSPAIDTEAFPDTKSDWYWSATVCAWSSDFAWFVGFSGGFVLSYHRDYGYGFVRAVRASQ